MSAPKMLIGDTSIGGTPVNQPAYGYTCLYDTGFQWDLICDNYRAYKKSKESFTVELPIQLDETMQQNLNIPFDSNVVLTLAVNSGFYPFTPLFQSSTTRQYTVRFLNDTWSGVLKSPWKYTERKFKMMLVEGLESSFSTDQIIEGTTIFRNGTSLDEVVLSGIREPEVSPDLSLPENYATVITKGSLPHTVVNKLPSKMYCGITSTIDIKASLQKSAQILNFIRNIEGSYFYVQMPSYKLFGKKLPMIHYAVGSGFDAWKVRCISNPIEITHDCYNQFTIKLTIALDL